MMKRIALVVVMGISGLFSASCEEAMVGAPCVPETDKGIYNADLDGKVYSIETRSVQCETRVCVTKTEAVAGVEGGQRKFSFCSCRCRDVEGHTYNDNPDKYDYLCECPSATTCSEVLSDIEGAPEKVTGSYCIPNCIAEGCESISDVCVPSNNSEEPWLWTCKEPDDDEE